jgi:hypothetical protein
MRIVIFGKTSGVGIPGAAFIAGLVVSHAIVAGVTYVAARRKRRDVAAS